MGFLRMFIGKDNPTLIIGTLPVPYSEVITGTYDGLFVTQEYHMKHCTYMWKKLQRAVSGESRGKENVDGYIGRMEHTEHCEMMLLGG